MRHKKEDIYKKGFDVAAGRSEEPDIELDFSSFRSRLQALTDANFDIGTFKKTNKQFGDKAFVIKALSNRDSDTAADISDFYYETSGMYNRLCKYLAQLYRYDWYITPFEVKKDSSNTVPEKKILKSFADALDYLDDSHIKLLLNDIALEVVRKGVYYGCIIDYGKFFSLQQLPKAYCRSRFKIGIRPVVELNVKFFDVYFTDVNYRIKMLQLFPEEVRKTYISYKEGKLKPLFPGDTVGWVMLDPATTVKFNIGNEDMPPLVGVIPSLIDLDSAQELDRKKTMQQLQKIIVQQLPRDKNGDLIFDVEEARDMHNSAVAMLKRAVGVDVLTTFADIDVADMDSPTATTATDALERVERTVYNNAGISQNMFNADGNIAQTYAAQNDAATMRELLYQFELMLNRVLEKFNTTKYEFKAHILETTIYNYVDMAKLYKDQTQMGYNKMLPQIALGHPQSTILASLHFENDYLHLEEIMIPPLTSNVINGDILNRNKTSTTDKKSDEENGSQGGRPEKADTEKSEKTIQNREAMG